MHQLHSQVVLQHDLRYDITLLLLNLPVFSGGCGRFWYGGCEAGPNHFESEDDCRGSCVEPRGGGVCFLAPVVGPCKGSYEEWYYDLPLRSCR